MSHVLVVLAAFGLVIADDWLTVAVSGGLLLCALVWKAVSR